MPGGWVGYLRSGQFFPPSESTIFSTEVLTEVTGPDGKGQKNIIRDLESERRHQMHRRVMVFTDAHKPIVISQLGIMYEIENFSEVWKTIDLSNNICKKIITQISTIYDTPPSWTIADEDGGVWKQIREDAQLDLVMPVVNRYTNLCNEVLVHVSVCGGKVKFNPITPDLFRVWEDPVDPTRMIAYAYAQAKPGRVGQIWHYWSIPDSEGNGAPENIVFEADPNQKIKILFKAPNPYLDQDENPALPGLLYHNNLPMTGCLDSTTGADIVEGAVMVCCMESGLNWLFRCDTWAQKYATGEMSSGPTGDVAGPQRFLIFRPTAGEKVDVGQFKSQADWAGMRQVINDKISNEGNNYGLSLAAIEVSGTPQSGFALIVRKEPLMAIRKRQVPIYRASDTALYATTAAVWNYERKNAGGDESKVGAPADGKPLLWPKDADLSISYAHYHVPMSPTEKESELLVHQVKISMGLTNVVEIFQSEHPELTLDECEEKVRKNAALTKDIAGDFMLVIGRAQVVNLQAAAAPPGAAPVPGAPGAEGQAPHQGQAALLTADGKPAAPPQVLKPGEKAPETVPAKKSEPK